MAENWCLPLNSRDETKVSKEGRDVSKKAGFFFLEEAKRQSHDFSMKEWLLPWVCCGSKSKTPFQFSVYELVQKGEEEGEVPL